MSSHSRLALARIWRPVLAAIGTLAITWVVFVAWNLSRPASAPAGSLTYVELLERVRTIEAPAGMNRGEPTMDCESGDRLCANAIRFDFTLPSAAEGLPRVWLTPDL